MSVIGFFDESAGVRSMTRLVMFLLTLFAGLDIATICTYVLVFATPSPAVITALVGALAALVLNGVVAIINRA